MTKIRRIQRICKRLGLQLVNKQSKDPEFIWTGKVLYTVRDGDGTHTPDIEDVCHEIAHWQIAAPSRRRYRDFGLPGQAEGGEYEEDLARLLGAAWWIYLCQEDIEGVLESSGYDRIRHTQTALTNSATSSWHIDPDLHKHYVRIRQWDELSHFLRQVLRLQNLGYLKNGRPTYYTNPGRGPWTRTSSRSSKKSATSSRKLATPASTRRSSQDKISVSAGSSHTAT